MTEQNTTTEGARTQQGHTPGPWYAGKRYGDTQVILDKSGNLQIALAYATHNASELDANARLIASAPDLLAALKRAKQDLTDLVHDLEIDPQFALDRVNAAIAKAEGRAR